MEKTWRKKNCAEVQRKEKEIGKRKTFTMNEINHYLRSHFQQPIIRIAPDVTGILNLRNSLIMLLSCMDIALVINHGRKRNYIFLRKTCTL